jgi:hypothetical protein
MKKIIVIMSMLLCFASPSQALIMFLPLLLPVSALTAVVVFQSAILAIGVVHYLVPQHTSEVMPDGTVRTPAAAAYIDLKIAPPAVVQKDLKANLTQAIIKTNVQGNPSKYPNLSAACASTSPPVGPPNYSTTHVGTVFQAPGGNATATNVIVYDGPYNTGTTWGSNWVQVDDGIRRIVVIFSMGGSGGSPIPPTTAEFNSRISVNNSTSGGSLSSNYQAEIDAMLKDPSYVPNFTDNSTGLPLVQPQPDHVATPTEVAVYNVLGQAQYVNDSAIAALSADPTNPVLQQAAAAAASALATAQIATSSSGSSAAAQAASLAAQAASAAALAASQQATATSIAAAQNLVAAQAAAASAAADAITANARAAASGTAADASAASAAGAAATLAAGRADIAAGWANLASIAAGQAGSAASSAASGAALVAGQAQQKAENDALVAPALPGDNVYAPGGEDDKPAKKVISDLLGSFISSSPLVAMVKSFNITTTGASAIVPIGMIYGQDLKFDFTRWQPVLAGCGGILLIIMHGFAVLIVVRGW